MKLAVMMRGSGRRSSESVVLKGLGADLGLIRRPVLEFVDPVLESRPKAKRGGSLEL